MEYTVADSFKITIKIMTVLRWYPSDTDSRLHKIVGYVLYIIFLMLFFILVVARMICPEESYNNTQVIYVTISFSYCFKLLPFLINGQRMKNCIHYFDDPYFSPKNGTERSISNQSVKLCQRIFMAYAIGAGSGEIIYLFPSVFPNYGLPLKIWLPYDPASGLIPYYSALMYIGAACVYDCFATMLLDPLIGGLAYHATGHLKILKHMVQNIHQISHTRDGINSDSVIYENLIKCVQYHNGILRFVDEFEKCFTWVIFSQFFGTVLTACFCCIGALSVLVPLATAEGVLYVSIIPIILCQVFFYCYYGTQLFEENNSLVTAIYESYWYKYDRKSKKLLVTFMERSKRPLIVTAGKFIDLTLVTYSKMIKSTYSLIACFK